ncbi:MAG: glycosyltransferase, partial [bacterium]|nr:glycosyltransferase [bacterium]
MNTPTISVVIPVYNSAVHLRECLRAIEASADAPLECIVVDDGSTDSSAEVALEFGARLVSSDSQSGPAKARNLGAKQAKGEILFFLDADVCVHEDTLKRVATAFGADPELDAVIGAYDEEPGSGDFLSQYKNLMHAFVHQHARHDASTFWSGCGAIRKDVFHEFGGF